jgi:hypothetical protein
VFDNRDDSADDDTDDDEGDYDAGLKSLLVRTGEAALRGGVQALRGTALLPFGGAAAGLPVAAAGSVVGAETALGPLVPPSSGHCGGSGNTPAVSAAPTAAVAGRILDIDGDTLLVGLGAGDGLALGDALLVKLGDGDSAPTVRLVVTRVRPRTCDAVFDKAAPAANRARVTIGQTAALESAK